MFTIAKREPRLGDVVRIVESGLYSGRYGQLVKNSGQYDDPWDFSAMLIPDNRKIGINAMDVEVLEGVSVIPVSRTSYAVSDEPVEIVGTAIIDSAKPEEAVILFPKNGVWADFLRRGELRAMSIAAFITDVKGDPVVSRA